MNYPQIMSPLSPLPLKVGVMSPSSCGSAAHAHIHVIQSEVTPIFIWLRNFIQTFW